MVILEAEGQIIEGTSGRLVNIGCRVDIKIGEQVFKDVRFQFSIENPNVERACNFEQINGKKIEIKIKKPFSLL